MRFMVTCFPAPERYFAHLFRAIGFFPSPFPGKSRENELAQKDKT
jgi:hypothetical protein